MVEDLAVTLGFDGELVEADDASFASVTLKIADELVETIIMPLEWVEPKNRAPKRRKRK